MYRIASVHLVKTHRQELVQPASIEIIKFVTLVMGLVPEIYGSKLTESEGVARGQGLFTIAINNCHLIGPLL